MEFSKLSLPEKFYLLISEGKFLKSFTHEYRKVNIYVMDGKYYRVRFDPSGDLIDKIEEIKVDDMAQLYFDKKTKALFFQQSHKEH